ncbi:unnamed protein product [Bursaphelenchus xylophilus]|uniref:(pine wood nematode) hypothetical protein n=1 Tax=Bursaphelenchus xylophilus TaxID=6326 RepID=A0A7I8XCJ8_BURXY|nr:unnamed protein product [Bursaphelenchus xylophilus]CAG9131412.1 unnamed protein product [Bursaphelenchus xylophilus]
MRLPFLLCLCIAITYGAFFGKNKFNKLREFTEDAEEVASLFAFNQTEKWFTQVLDHFDEANDETWQQRYFVNDVYWKENGPQFLNIGGEGPVRGERIFNESYPMTSWAKKLNAQIWSLEHRFYGKSHPKPNQSVENLQYLTSRQALADLANFIRTKNHELKLKNPKWIVFGGSYPGALALWFRVVYPDLTVGAVGSSAPIDIQMDFYGYLRVCQEAYRKQSPKCAENIDKAFTYLHRMMDSKKGRERLEANLNVQPKFEKQKLNFQDLENLFGNSFSLFQGAVQYSRVNAGRYATGYSIPDVCRIMEQPVFSPITHLVKVAKYLEGDVFEDDYQGDIAFLKREDFHEESAARSWIWQTCNEFGYFQTTSFEKNIFGVGTPVDYYRKICSDVYGPRFAVSNIVKALRATRDYYGEPEDYNGTNVVIPNGSIDPWSALGTYVNGPSQYSYLIEGAAHCADMSPPGRNDVPGLAHIRSVIFEKLQEWIKDKEVKNVDKNEKKEEKKVEEETAEPQEVFHAPGEVCFGCGGYGEKLNLPEESTAIISKKFYSPQDGYPAFEETPRNAEDEPKLSTIEQVVDHFEKDPKKQKTFKQHFYINNKYYKEGGPVLLLIGGEGPLSYYKPFIFEEKSSVLKYAKELNASLIGLEHRFYGKSIATSDLSVKSLQYLTSRQALADINYFIETIKKTPLYKDAKWVPIGGSYAGFLAAQFRQLYPSSSVGSIGSSGPLDINVDFYMFNVVAQFTLGGCAGKIKEGFDYINQLLNTIEGREIINQKLGPCYGDRRFKGEYVDPFDKMEFYRDLIIRFTETIQYAEPGPNGTVAKICNLWNNDQHDVFYKFNAVYKHCYEMDYSKRIDSLSDISIDGPGAKSRCWCYFVEWCRRAYDPSFTRDKIEANIKKTNKLYGGERGYRATKHLHIYGTADPWHAAGLFTVDAKHRPTDEDHGEDVVTEYLVGTSHMADLFPEQEAESPKVKDARKLTVETIKRWIK